MDFVVIAIDGPSCSGKSTIARKLAKKLGFVHLNSGALYRAVALLALRKGLDLDNEGELLALAQSSSFVFSLNKEGETELTVDGQDESAFLYSAEAGQGASKVALLPKVRQVLTSVQRKAAENYPVVLEGRDAGTVVFPLAPYKYYLDALPEVRANRRLQQLKLQNPDLAISLDEVQKDLALRDERDINRDFVPLRQAEDAVLIDTSYLSEEDVIDRITHDVVGGFARL